MTYERKNPEPVLNHVCLLLIQRKDMVIVEPVKSGNLEALVVKALSHKFEHENQVDQALQDLNAKYKLSGIFNPSEKIEKLKTFKIEDKTFHVFQVNQDRGKLQLEGKCRFVKIKDLIKEIRVNIRGEGDCIVTPSLKMALN